MQQIIDFLLSNVYIVLIGLFLLSRLFSKSKSKPGGMPSFGGGSGHDRPGHEGFPGGESLDQPPARGEGPAQSSWPGNAGPTGGGGQQQRPWPGSVDPPGGGGQRQRPWPGSAEPTGDWQKEQGQGAARQQQVLRSQSEPDRRPKRDQPNRIGGRSSSSGDSEASRRGGSASGKGKEMDIPGKAVGLRSSSLLGGKPTAEDMRKAVLWAEVLGPPRSKRHLR
ncbi:hypothetical protein A7K91_23620 [Paenibacillus oryzae]|uniref:Uncharacterized protein n=1 Tax=Paenibacillus oryzae TaxID=1844972 RepID=A0A1A5YCH6_9BACL|nr:hypothetical protein [Paenibacillus oryzae]OBR63095.1 hypothetical protein A7K91_23620 [Paenibacillus oryzae]